MADEEKKDQEETKDEAAPEAEEKKDDAPKAEEEKADNAPKEDSGQKGDAESDDAPAAEGEDASSNGEAAADSSDSGGGDGEPSGDDEELGWKAKRRLERSREPHEARPQRSPEERAAERAQLRAAAVKERSNYRKRARTKGEKGTGTPPAERDAVARKVRRGTVVSDKGDKTITVRIDVARRHPAYEKVVRRSSTLHAHDERNEAGAGDLVQVVETRPISKRKRWRLTEILEKAK